MRNIMPTTSPSDMSTPKILFLDENFMDLKFCVGIISKRATLNYNKIFKTTNIPRDQWTTRAEDITAAIIRDFYNQMDPHPALAVSIDEAIPQMMKDFSRFAAMMLIEAAIMRTDDELERGMIESFKINTSEEHTNKILATINAIEVKHLAQYTNPGSNN